MSNIFTITLNSQQIENIRKQSTIDVILAQLDSQIMAMSVPIKEIGNLCTDLIDAHEEREDHRFKSWAKRITGVDRSKVNGYAFEGDFIPDRDIEYEVKPGLYLAMVTQGSRAHQSQYYQIIYMDMEGLLHPTEISTNTERDRSWALRIRDRTAEMLQHLALVTVNDDGYAVVNENLKTGVIKR